MFLAPDKHARPAIPGRFLKTSAAASIAEIETADPIGLGGGIKDFQSPVCERSLHWLPFYVGNMVATVLSVFPYCRMCSHVIRGRLMASS